MTMKGQQALVAQYIVGIDLGTSNTAVAYAEKKAGATTGEIKLFEVEQLVTLGEVAAKPTLPSVRYHPTVGELNEADLQLPWSAPDVAGVSQAIVGELARELGTQVPGRLVSSAKSWLSHGAVDRTAPILPWGGAEGVAKVSPVAASASYLAHLRTAWNHRFSNAPLEKQDIVLTVPASFDEGARALTQHAARTAGLRQVRLVEEPQAAFYDWLFRHRDNLADSLADTRLALVCDVGGGTTDLTLIKIEAGETEPKISRIAVGDHLILGGDNMDLGLAHVVESRIAGAKLSTAQLSQLVQQCRRAKETLLATDAPDSATVTLLGAGAKLIGGARSAELSREEVDHMVVDGFFPTIAPDERPQRTRAGLVEFGLPYVRDPAITRHLSAFLSAHQHVSRDALAEHAPPANELPVPDAVLFNGGVFRSESLAERTIEVMSHWRGAPVRRLSNASPDLAVARGAVAYGLARAGAAPKIAGGAARSYFVLLDEDEGQQTGVCVLPRGTEEGQDVALQERTFALRVGQPVKFDLASSTADTPYTRGQIVPYDDESFHRLPPLATVLKASSAKNGETPVQLVSGLTELGILEMYCVSVEETAQRWKLEFQLRGSPSAPGALHELSDALPPRFEEAIERITRMYGPAGQKVERKEIKRLRTELEKTLGPRNGWDTPLLRELYVALWDGVSRRRRSADHERLWFSLTGFCLRPGFGYPLDDWRVKELWKIFEQGVQFAPESQVWSEWWTAWRRVAGGLDKTAQTRLLDDIAFYLQPAGTSKLKKPPGQKKLGLDDMLRLAASLERVPVERKIELGEWLLKRLRKPKENVQCWWALGRIGVRVPLYGSAHNVIPPDVATHWVEALLNSDWKKTQPAAFAAASIARVSGDRERDLDESLRHEIAQKLTAVKAPAAWRIMVTEHVELDQADENRVFGESLPPGLRLIN